MAKKLYEESTVATIADLLRQYGHTSFKYKFPRMPEFIEATFNDQYEYGHVQGQMAGREYIKTSEARTADNVNLTNQGVPENAYSAYITVNVDAGYYAENTKKTFRASDGDLDSIVDGVYEIGHNDGYDAGYTEGYNDGLAAGGGGGDEPYDPTTVWLINDVPVAISSGIAGTTINVLFNSAGEEFVKIRHNSLALTYYRSDGTAVSVWDSLSGWKNDAYKTITFPEEITDQTLINWLDTNATLISGGGGGGGQDADISPEDSLTFMEQVQSPSVVYMSLYNYCFIPDNFGAYGGRTIEDMIEIEYSDLNSNPLTISLINYTDMYAHYYIRATDMANEKQGHLVHIEALPQGDTSIDVGSPQTIVPACDWKIEVQGARFTKYA